MAKLLVHYHRSDGHYHDASLWTWDWNGAHTPTQQEVFADSTDAYGVTFEIEADRYGLDPSRLEIGFIPRLERNWDKKDDPERRWTPDLGYEIWIRDGEGTIFTSPPDISPRIRTAFLDAPTVVTCSFTAHASRANGLKGPEGVRLCGPGGETILLKSVLHSNDYGACFEFEAPPAFEGRRWTLHVPGFRPAVLRPRGILFDPERYLPRMRAGTRCEGAHTDFQLFIPGAERVSIVLYDRHAGPANAREEPLGHAGHGMWTGRLPGDLDGTFYMVRIKHPQDDAPVEVQDIWAVNATGWGTRPRLTNLRRTDPEGFRPIARPPFSGRLTDAVIYELHVRDFSIAPSSGMQHRGRYLAFTERGTHLPHHPEVSTGIDHLVELGITHVQLLPIQDFEGHEDRGHYNWGYMTANFNSPEGSYATVLHDDSRIRETKRMIAALHAAGLRVVMDVVYNHVSNGAAFELTVPGYYLRVRDDGTRSNGAGVGNEFRSEAPMARRFIVDSLRFWVEEYGVDGFRFDLLGLTDHRTVHEVRDEMRRIDPGIVLYGEPWVAGPTTLHPISDKWALRGTGVGAFNDHFRNALKGEPDNTHWGYVQGAHNRDAVARGIAGSIDDWTLEPGDSINYADCHDNLTLWDKIAGSAPQESETERIKMHNLAFGILAVSQGALFLHAGHEFARSKGGNHNSYNAPDEVNRLDWSRKVRYRSTHEFTRGMIALRRAHPLFRLPSASQIRDRINFLHLLPKSPQCIAFTIDGEAVPGESWHQALVLVNPYGRPRMFPLPRGNWRVHALGLRAELQPFRTVEGNLQVPGRSMAVLAGGR